MGRRGLGSLPRPKLQPGAIHALLWMLYMAELTQYGVPHQLTAGDLVNPTPLPLVPPCTCHYRVIWTRFALAPAGTQARHRTVVEGSSFSIDPGCEHHGDLRREEYFDATYVDVLDEDERRNQ